jgi:hypothetical protein
MQHYASGIKKTLALVTVLAAATHNVCAMEREQNLESNGKELAAVPYSGKTVKLQGIPKEPYTDGLGGLPVEMHRKIAYYFTEGEDAYAFGGLNKYFVTQFTHNYEFLDYMTKNRTMTPSYFVEDTLAYTNVNRDFRDICIHLQLKQSTADAKQKRFAGLRALWNTGLISPNTCAKASSEEHSERCVIPLVTACVNCDLDLLSLLLSKKTHVACRPREVCSSQRYATLADATLRIGVDKSLFPRSEMIKALCQASDGTFVFPNTTLHDAIDIIFEHTHNPDDYKGFRTLIRLGAPINGLDPEKCSPMMTLVRKFVTMHLNKGKPGSKMPNVSEGSFKKYVTLLLDAGADLKLRNSEDRDVDYVVASTRTVKVLFESITRRHAAFQAALKAKTQNK